MKPARYSAKDAQTIDLGTKLIYKYPLQSKGMDIGKMAVNGRHPEGKDSFIIEHACSFIMYILEGKGTVYAGDEVFTVGPEDVVFVPKENKFAVEGEFSYVTFDSPAYYAEQSEEIKA